MNLTTIRERIPDVAEIYKREVLTPALPDSSLLCKNLANELEKILASYQRAYERRNEDPRSAVISFREGKFVVGGKEIGNTAGDSTFVLYSLYQQFGKDVPFSAVDALVSWSTTERTMEVLKPKVDASKRVILTISTSPLRYRLEPALPQDHQPDFEYHIDRNYARQLHYLVEVYQARVLATTPGLGEISSLSSGLQRVLSQYFFQIDPHTRDGSDILFAGGNYSINKGARRPMRSVLGFLLFYLLHNEGEFISEDLVRDITAWKRMPENIQILQEQVSSSQVFELGTKERPKKYALVRKRITPSNAPTTDP